MVVREFGQSTNRYRVKARLSRALPTVIRCQSCAARHALSWGRTQEAQAIVRAEMERRIEAWLVSPDRIARARVQWMAAKGET